MTLAAPPSPPPPGPRPDRLYPLLTPAQGARISPPGRRRHVEQGEVLGSQHGQGTLRIGQFLTRNGHPHTMLDLERDAGVQELLDRFHVGAADIPVVITCGEVVLRNPTNNRSPTRSASTTRSIRPR